MTLKSIIENNDTKQGRVFDLAIQGLIVVYLVELGVINAMSPL
jgi:hypothetical protein